MIKRDKNIKITSNTHELLKTYCEENGLKMFSFVEKIIREKCNKKPTDVKIKSNKDLYNED